jgi:hypothetical protein
MGKQTATTFIATPMTDGDEDKGRQDAMAEAKQKLGGEDVYNIEFNVISPELLHTVWGRDLPEPPPPAAREPEPSQEEREAAAKAKEATA